MPNNSSSSSFLHSSHTNSTTFPITAVAIIGILATGFLLVSYYIFVIKCCLNWHRIDLLGRFSFSGRQRPNEGPLTVVNSSPENRGLDEAIIRSIPIFQYKKNGRKRSLGEEKCLSECAICLNEFQEEEKLRVLPNCGHIFHIDCIDIWLQNNANCPLCRTSISAAAAAATTTSRFNLSPNFSRNDDDDDDDDEDYVVIEMGEENMSKVQETGDSGEISDNNFLKRKKRLKCVTSMGDECIDIREGNKDEGFDIQPIRRSFSMDSASDPQLHLAIQVILQQQQQLEQVIISSPRTVRRSFFSFGHDRTSRRSSILPLHLES